jgi:adenylate kinase family enzyme
MGAATSLIHTEELADEYLMELITVFQTACLKAAGLGSEDNDLSDDEKMAKFFELADTNHDGKLDEYELSALFENLTDLTHEQKEQLQLHMPHILKKTDGNGTFSFVLNQFSDLMNPAKAIQCCPALEDDEPKRIVFVGCTGSGKSSLCTALTGQSPENTTFEIGDSASSQTINCSQSLHRWFGEDGQDEFLCIDTPGLDDELNRDDEHINSIIKTLQELEYINAVVLVLNSEQLRFSTSLQGMVKAFEGAFDCRFYKHTSVVMTRWYLSRFFQASRKKKKRTETDVEKEMNHKFISSKNLGINFPMPMHFVDSFYNDEDMYAPEETAEGRTRLEAFRDSIPNTKFRTGDIQTVKPKIKKLQGLEGASRIELDIPMGNISPILFDPTLKILEWIITPSLPDGILVDEKTGRIFGTPTTVAPPKQYSVSARSAGGESNQMTFELSVQHSQKAMQDIAHSISVIAAIDKVFDETNLPSGESLDTYIEEGKASLSTILDSDITGLKEQYGELTSCDMLIEMCTRNFNFYLSSVENSYRILVNKATTAAHETERAVTELRMLILNKTTNHLYLKKKIDAVKSMDSSDSAIVTEAEEYLSFITPRPCRYASMGCPVISSGDQINNHQTCCPWGQPFQFLKKSNLIEEGAGSCYKKFSLEANGGDVSSGCSGKYEWYDEYCCYIFVNSAREIMAVRRKDQNDRDCDKRTEFEILELNREDLQQGTVLSTSTNSCQKVDDADFGSNVIITAIPQKSFREIEADSDEYKEVRLKPNSVKLLYFGGMWCPYCPPFTAILKVFYERVLELKGPEALDVVFVSSDRSEDDQVEYYDTHHGDWNVVPYVRRDYKEFLSQKYDVRGIPSCIQVNNLMERVDNEEGDATESAMDMLRSFPWQMTGPIQDNAAEQIYSKLLAMQQPEKDQIDDDGENEDDKPCDIFISLRYAESQQQASLIRAALKERGLKARIINVDAGVQLDEEIVKELDACRMAIIMGSKNYGMATSATFSTKEELQYILSENIPFFLVKTCDKFLQSLTRLKLPSTVMYYKWDASEQETLPGDLCDQIFTKFNSVLKQAMSSKQ